MKLYAATVYSKDTVVVRLEREFENIRDEYRGLLEPHVVEGCLQHSLDWLTAEPRINTFVPVLAQRHAREQLRSIAQRRGLSDKTPPTPATRDRTM